MKLYRAIKVENIPFSLDGEDKDKWNSCELKDRSEKPWWHNESNSSILDAFISKMILERWNTFVLGSMRHSAYKGGRFNPEKSCESLYCSESPETAILEVCFHVLEDNLRQIKKLASLSNWSRNTLGKSLPDELEFKVIVLESKIVDDSISIFDLSNQETLEKALATLGYNRYLHSNKKLSNVRLFVISNDYSICRQITALAKNENCNAIKFPSARTIDSNIVLFGENIKIKSTGYFAVCDVVCTPSFDGSPHNISLRQDKSVKKFRLGSSCTVAAKRKLEVRFAPQNGIDGDVRTVILQKFIEADVV
jgi:hypothetical protein